ncbi:Os06g0181900, partial [Oryza sativa Japonica Group]
LSSSRRRLRRGRGRRRSLPLATTPRAWFLPPLPPLSSPSPEHSDDAQSATRLTSSAAAAGGARLRRGRHRRRWSGATRDVLLPQHAPR